MEGQGEEEGIEKGQTIQRKTKQRSKAQKEKKTWGKWENESSKDNLIILVSDENFYQNPFVQLPPSSEYP